MAAATNANGGDAEEETYNICFERLGQINYTRN
jgi:hypothetical protein